MRILFLHQKNLHTDVSLLAVLIAVLNLSAMGNVLTGNESIHFLNIFQKVINVTQPQLPFAYKSVGMLAISNIFAQSEKASILSDTKDFAFLTLKSWRQFLADCPEDNSMQVIRNLIYGALVLFYNILQKRQGSVKIEEKS